MEDLTGKQLGPYQVVAPLGEGGMAAVYRAYQPSIDRFVALKILPRHFSQDPEFIERFRQEARVIANLQHPHILPVHDFGEAEGYTYLAMRFVRGGELGQWMADNHPLSLGQIKRVITQIGDALDYAHSQEIIHRDVKPSNVLLDERDNCLLTDFGLAKMMQSSVKLTRTGGILGTPAYMSPEQGMGQDVDHRSDIYALGVILYEMVTGRPPYQAETPMAVMIKHIQAPLPPPGQYSPDLPEDLERVILKALAKKKDDRFATAGEMVKALQNAVESPTAVSGTESPTVPQMDPAAQPAVPAPPVTPGGEEEKETVVAASQSPGRPRRLWLYGAVGLVVILAAIGLLSLAGDGADPANIEPFVGDTPPEIEAILERAYAAWDREDFEAALGEFEAAIDLEPGIYDLYCQRGDVLANMEDFSAAIEDFDACRQIAQKADDDETASYAFGQTAVARMRQAGQTEGEDLAVLRAFYDEALADPLAPPWLYCERGELNLGYAANEAALLDFERCRELVADDYWPERSEAVINMIQGQAALDAEDYPTAVEFLQRWAELDPEGPYAFCSLGYAYAGLEAFPEAQMAFTQCAEIAGGYGDLDLQAEAESGQFFAAGREAFISGAFEEAIAAYSQAIDLRPDNQWLYCSRGEAFLEAGLLDEAEADFRECPDHEGTAETFSFALVLSGPLGDGSFADSANRGAERAMAELGVAGTIVETSGMDEHEAAVRGAVEAGNDIVLSLTADTQLLLDLAAEFPDQKIGAPADVFAESLPDNMAAFHINAHQSSFLVGLIAGSMTETGTVGAVVGGDTPTINQFFYAYKQGVLEVCPDCEVLVGYLDFDFNNPALGLETALGQYGQGADIVYQIAGGSGEGVLEAAKQTGNFAIGVDSNQDWLQPGSVIVSMLKRVDITTYTLIEWAVNGTFQGGFNELGMAEGATGLSWDEGSTAFEEEGPAGMVAKLPAVRETVEAYRQRILEGDYEVCDALRPTPVCDPLINH